MKKKVTSKSMQLQPYILSLLRFMIKSGYVEEPIPEIRLSGRKQSENPIEVRTGHYSPEDGEICLFIADRHPKDILRTLAHELIHVQQDHEGRLNGFNAESSIKDDEHLREIESEAFLKGNLALRDWTEEYTHKEKAKMNESMKVTLTIGQLRKLVNESRMNPDEKLYLGEWLDEKHARLTQEELDDFFDFVDYATGTSDYTSGLTKMPFVMFSDLYIEWMTKQGRPPITLNGFVLED